jgi:DNA (cytosine-5)-methyltransferase 1
MAGKRLGKEDDRHLWPEMLRAIREIQPRWVVGENVLGIINWSGGLVFHEVQTDLEAQGYEVQPFVLPAVSVNAPHRRDRVWFIAHRYGNRQHGSDCQHEEQSDEGGQYAQRDTYESNDNGDAADTKCSRLEHRNKTRNLPSEEREARGEMGESSNEFEANGNGEWDVTDTDNTGLERSKVGGSIGGSRSESHQLTSRFICSTWQNFPTKSPICDGNDGISDRLDGITFSKWRQESIKAGGNAVVPQVVLQIFRTIEEYEKTHAQ